MATPRTLSKRSRERLSLEQTTRNTSTKRSKKRLAIHDATPQANDGSRDLCTAMSGASLASGNSDHTGVIKRLRSSLAPTTRDTPDFNATTSPRLDSRLARRPQPQFPYAIQPFQLLPASPEERDQVSVEEANRRIQQARALSVRQQRFGQLLELASAGYIPAPQCGGNEEEEGGRPEMDPVPRQAIPNARLSPDIAQDRPRSAQASPNAEVQAQAHNPDLPVPVVVRRLTNVSTGCVLTSRHGQGSIRVLRMSQ